MKKASNFSLILSIVALYPVTASAVDVSFTVLGNYSYQYGYESMSVSNTGVVSAIDNGTQYLWTSHGGFVTIDNDAYFQATEISSDGQSVLYTVNAAVFFLDNLVYKTPSGILDENDIDIQPLSMSKNGQVLGGGDQASSYPAIWVDGQTTVYNDPRLHYYQVRGLSDSGDVKLAHRISFSSPLYEPYIINPDNSLTEIPYTMFDVREISGDGKTVLGRRSSGGCFRAVIWSEDDGLTELPCDMLVPTDISGNGDVVIGVSAQDANGNSEPLIWDAEKGLRNIKTVLDSHGVDVSGWTDMRPVDISEDGYKIVGVGTNEQGLQRGFLIEIVPVCIGF